MPEAPDLRFPIEELQNFCSLSPKKYETCCDLSDLESPINNSTSAARQVAVGLLPPQPDNACHRVQTTGWRRFTVHR
jgi:hypothetical protein